LEFYSPKSEELLLACPNSASFPDLFPQFAQLYRSWSVKRPGYLVHCRSIILDVLCRLYTRSQSFSLPHNKGIERCIELIHANYQHTYSSRELAEVAGVSPSYFRYLFKQSTGLSPLQYQNQIKIDKAKDLLLSGECNVTEAAEAVGFANIYYFSRLFKKLTGIPPSQYSEG
jgi:AraC-like DNA-binding protein